MQSLYEVKLSAGARRQLKKLPHAAQSRVVQLLELLAEHPRPPKAIKLSDRDGHWRVRTGDYRIIYAVKDRELIAMVIKIGHRREVYR